jgi:hypothetical protein
MNSNKESSEPAETTCLVVFPALVLCSLGGLGEVVGDFVRNFLSCLKYLSAMGGENE